MDIYTLPSHLKGNFVKRLSKNFYIIIITNAGLYDARGPKMPEQQQVGMPGMMAASASSLMNSSSSPATVFSQGGAMQQPQMQTPSIPMPSNMFPFQQRR
jgi:hypothetical protein